MRIAFSLFLVVLSFSVIPLAQNAPDAIPKDAQSLTDGFYCENQQGWDRLQPISMAGGGMKHAGKLFVPGLTPQIVDVPESRSTHTNIGTEADLSHQRASGGEHRGPYRKGFGDRSL